MVAKEKQTDMTKGSQEVQMIKLIVSIAS